MNRRRYLSVIAAAITLPIAFGIWSSSIGAKQPKPPNPNVSDPPTYVVDPFWPKPLPDNWVTGEVGGTCIDSQDHVFIVTRGFPDGRL